MKFKYNIEIVGDFDDVKEEKDFVEELEKSGKSYEEFSEKTAIAIRDSFKEDFVSSGWSQVSVMCEKMEDEA